MAHFYCKALLPQQQTEQNRPLTTFFSLQSNKQMTWVIYLLVVHILQVFYSSQNFNLFVIPAHLKKYKKDLQKHIH